MYQALSKLFKLEVSAVVDEFFVQRLGAVPTTSVLYFVI